VSSAENAHDMSRMGNRRADRRESCGTGKVTTWLAARKCGDRSQRQWPARTASRSRPPVLKSRSMRSSKTRPRIGRKRTVHSLLRYSRPGAIRNGSNLTSCSFISLAAPRTPSGYSPSRRFTVRCRPFHFIRRAHCRTTFRQFSNTPFHLFSSAGRKGEFERVFRRPTVCAAHTCHTCVGRERAASMTSMTSMCRV